MGNQHGEEPPDAAAAARAGEAPRGRRSTAGEGSRAATRRPRALRAGRGARGRAGRARAGEGKAPSEVSVCGACVRGGPGQAYILSWRRRQLSRAVEGLAVRRYWGHGYAGAKGNLVCWEPWEKKNGGRGGDKKEETGIKGFPRSVPVSILVRRPRRVRGWSVSPNERPRKSLSGSFSVHPHFGKVSRARGLRCGSLYGEILKHSFLLQFPPFPSALLELRSRHPCKRHCPPGGAGKEGKEPGGRDTRRFPPPPASPPQPLSKLARNRLLHSPLLEARPGAWLAESRTCLSHPACTGECMNGPEVHLKGARALCKFLNALTFPVYIQLGK